MRTPRPLATIAPSPFFRTSQTGRCRSADADLRDRHRAGTNIPFLENPRQTRWWNISYVGYRPYHEERLSVRVGGGGFKHRAGCQPALEPRRRLGRADELSPFRILCVIDDFSREWWNFPAKANGWRVVGQTMSFVWSGDPKKKPDKFPANFGVKGFE
ncbi:hypothetical protein MESS4_750252 [Mesorhizobium sp. STM 4661]|nr:hypothetical protein MESS4_750252 [Mesorhizobium sp. STM 4661]